MIRRTESPGCCMELVWKQVNLEGVWSNTGVQAGEEGGQDEGKSRDRERGADPSDAAEAEMPAHGERLATCTGQGNGRLRVSGQLEGRRSDTGRL